MLTDETAGRVSRVLRSRQRRYVRQIPGSGRGAIVGDATRAGRAKKDVFHALEIVEIDDIAAIEIGVGVPVDRHRCRKERILDRIQIQEINQAIVRLRCDIRIAGIADAIAVGIALRGVGSLGAIVAESKIPSRSMSKTISATSAS